MWGDAAVVTGGFRSADNEGFAVQAATMRQPSSAGIALASAVVGFRALNFGCQLSDPLREIDASTSSLQLHPTYASLGGAHFCGTALARENSLVWPNSLVPM